MNEEVEDRVSARLRSRTTKTPNKSFLSNKTRHVLKNKDMRKKLKTEDTIVSETEKMKKPANEVINRRWIYANRLSYGEVENKCFICSKARSKKKNLVQCYIRYTANFQCDTMFHLSCLQDYNAGDFDLKERHRLDFEQKNHQRGQKDIDRLICPLHHCDPCWTDKRKSTAIKGELIECGKCYRAFHEECRPAGAKIETEMKRSNIENRKKPVYMSNRITTCHTHCEVEYFAIAKNTKLTHLPFCCECEKVGDKKTLIPCSQCIKSFHENCNAHMNKNPICNRCIRADSIPIGMNIIGRFRNSFYPGVTVNLEDYPDHLAENDKLGHYFEKPGFVAIKWAGCENLFSLLHYQSIISMFNGSYDLIGKRLKNTEYRNAWISLEKDIRVPRPQFDDDKTAYQEILTSCYLSRDLMSHHSRQGPPVDDLSCDCPQSDPYRCSEESNCYNRASNQECPEACENTPGGCENRNLSNRYQHPHIKVDKTPGKGYGILATEDIKKGSFIAEFAGVIIDIEEKQKRIQERGKNYEEHLYMMQLDAKRVIDSRWKGNIARFMNHSCDPNCYADTVDIVIYVSKKGNITKLDKRIRITTFKDIKKGEELCFNYNMGEFGADCHLPVCKCNSENCTGSLGRKNGTSKVKNGKEKGLMKRKSNDIPTAVRTKKAKSNKVLCEV